MGAAGRLLAVTEGLCHGDMDSLLLTRPQAPNGKETRLCALIRTRVLDDLIYKELLETITTVIRPSPEISLKNWPLHHVT